MSPFNGQTLLGSTYINKYPCGYLIAISNGYVIAYPLSLERITGLEPATFALARRRSTKWAKSALVVPPVGIEPTTRGFSVPCSTNWATEAYSKGCIKKWRPEGDSNPWPLAWQASVLTNWTTGPHGGNNRARTYDPLLVRQMLSQLSYAPICIVFLAATLILYHTLAHLSIPFSKLFWIFFGILQIRALAVNVTYFITNHFVCQ